jgi:glycosyltransferase involved in cell wall biosynthesis
MKKFSVLFTVDSTADDECSALQRFRVLKAGLERLGVETGMIFLGDYPIGNPRIFLAANTPLFLKTARHYDFVHSAGLSVMAMGAAKAFANYKIIYDVHGSTQEYRLTQTAGFDPKVYYQMLAASLAWQAAEKTADYFVTVSEPLRQEILTHGIKPQRTTLLYNGVDTQLFKPAKEKPSGAFTVTYAGAYQKWQGIENLVEAISLLKDTDIKFRLMGFQKHDQPLKHAIEARLGSRVELVDFQPRTPDGQPPAFVEQMAQSDVLVIPRYTDPQNPIYSNPAYVRRTFGWLPTKFGEYIATGRPIIVTDLDVAADFTEQYDCGFVCDPSPKALAATILKAKNTPAAELDQKGANGRKLAQEQFDSQVVARRYFTVLSSLFSK